ncbi:MAG: Beta-lactamase [Caulobacter sp.]|nr:Beta-lactamase [Caulobacter sp.]
MGPVLFVGLLGLLVGLAAPALAGPCEAALAYSDMRAGVSVLVLKDGKAVCEAYTAGGGPKQGWELWSGTKSFSGLIAAAAVQDGLLSLDEKVSDTIPEWRGDPQRAGVTIRQLLNLTSGLATTIGRPPAYAGAIASPFTAGPGTRFQYGAEPFQVFGAVMNRKLAAAKTGDADVLAYLTRRILGPAGATPTGWRRTAAGEPLMPQGSIFTAREWARVGEFVRAGGVVDGRPLVDPAAFRAQFTGSKINPAYGVSWWLPGVGGYGPRGTTSDFSVHAAELPKDLVIAAGAGYQRLYVIPSCGLTIVRQAPILMSQRAGTPAWSDFAFLAPILKGWC